jgi:hypothetical protein
MQLAIMNPHVMIWMNHQNVLIIAAASASWSFSLIFSPIVLHQIRQIFFNIMFPFFDIILN